MAISGLIMAIQALSGPAIFAAFNAHHYSQEIGRQEACPGHRSRRDGAEGDLQDASSPVSFI